MEQQYSSTLKYTWSFAHDYIALSKQMEHQGHCLGWL